MSRKKTPAIMKAKDVILELSDEDQDAIVDWLDLLMEVRAQERERAQAKLVKEHEA